MGNQLIEKEEIETYLKIVTTNFEKEGFEIIRGKVENFEIIIAKVDKYKWEWIESQLNIFAILSTQENITKEIIETFSKLSRDYAINNKNANSGNNHSNVVSFSLLTSFNIDDEAIDWVQNRPDKYFPAFEMPVISDLKNNELYYYDQTPAWGGLYYRFLRDFIKNHF